MGLLFVSVQSKHRNSLFWYTSETTKTNCFETNRKKPEKTQKKKKTGKTLNFRFKKSKICSISNCFGSIETSKLSVLVQKRNNRNKRSVSDSGETSFGSSFSCFVWKLFSKDTLHRCHQMLHFSPCTDVLEQRRQ